MKHLFILAFILCLTPLLLPAQNLNGFWKGTFNMNMGCFPVNNIELQLTVVGKDVTGASYHYLDIDNYVKKNATGSYSFDDKKLIVQEDSVTALQIPPTCKVCIKRYELTYSRVGQEEILKGQWTGHLMGSAVSCESGSIILSRVKESAFKAIPEILVDTGIIRLDFYDNGQIDNDSISVIINNKLVLSHQKLDARPITTYVKIDLQNPYQEVQMVAENLGSIPPNTAVLVITAQDKRYELFLSATESMTAKVRFIYDRKKR